MLKKTRKAVVRKVDAAGDMQMSKREAHFITALKGLLKSCKGEYISLGDMLKYLKDDALLFLIAIVVLPTSMPIPTPPGFTTIFGIPLCILTIQMIYKLDTPWLPRWLAKRSIKASTFQLFVDKAEPFFNKANSFLKPRYEEFLSRTIERFAGLLAFLCAVAITLPIIFGNWVPSIGILVISIGFLYKDGLAVAIGMGICMLGLVICAFVVGTFWVVVVSAFNWIVTHLHF